MQHSILLYLLDPWNWVDIIHLFMNSGLILMSLYCYLMRIEIEDGVRTWAAIAAFMTWMKFFDWLRLFDSTAFFIRLMTKTIYSIRYFLPVMLIWYMAFSCAFWIIDLNKAANDDEYVLGHITRLWVFDAFEYTYKLGLGEFSLDGQSEG